MRNVPALSKKPLCRQVSLPNGNVIFNRQVDLDILHINQKAILHMVDHDTRFAAAKYVREFTEYIWDTFIQAWVLVFTGYPTSFLTDQGPTFTSRMWRELCVKHSIVLNLIPIQSHNSNGIVEHQHFILKKIFSKLKTDRPELSDKMCLMHAVKCINDVYGPHGFAPSTLVFGAMARPLHEDLINSTRFDKMVQYRRQMQRAVSKDRLNRAIKSSTPPDHVLEAGQDVLLVYIRERE
jgi:hypothetical protein